MLLSATLEHCCIFQAPRVARWIAESGNPKRSTLKHRPVTCEGGAVDKRLVDRVDQEKPGSVGREGTALLVTTKGWYQTRVLRPFPHQIVARLHSNHNHNRRALDTGDTSGAICYIVYNTHIEGAVGVGLGA